MKHFNHIHLPFTLSCQLPLSHWFPPPNSPPFYTHAINYFYIYIIIWEITYNICLSHSGYFHLAWWFTVPSILVQAIYFHSSLWLNNTPLSLYIIFNLSYSSLEWCQCWFQSLAVVNSAAINMSVLVSLLSSDIFPGVVQQGIW
jgi:hypothetical protein